MRKVKKAVFLAVFVFAASFGSFAQVAPLPGNENRIRITPYNYSQLLAPDEPTLIDRWYGAVRTFIFLLL